MSDPLSQHPSHVQWAHAVLRVFAGAVIMQHGVQKLLGLLGGHVAAVGTLSWAGGIIETVGGALLIIGLCTRITAFIMSGEMAVAYFKFHAPRGFWPVLNHGEVPVLLCFIFLYLAATGAGPFSIDWLLKRRRPHPVMSRG
jgi:putative oxidoreductase